jgi:5-methylcytosine-specific restriction endonuclease McrA
MLRTRRIIFNQTRTPLIARPSIVGSRAWLIEQLDAQVRRIVRARDKVCVTCGSRFNLEVSHFYPRWFLSIRFDLRNCNLQCQTPCHRAHHVEHSKAYENYLKRTYGNGVIAELNARRQSLVKLSDSDLEDLLTSYRRM